MCYNNTNAAPVAQLDRALATSEGSSRGSSGGDGRAGGGPGGLPRR